MRYLFVIAFSFLLSSAFCQVNYSTKNKKAIQYYEDAGVYIHQRNYTKAINTLYLALQKDQDFIEAHNKLAFCFELLKDKEKQQIHLEEVVRLDTNGEYPNSKYLLANVYYHQGEYLQAKNLLTNYLKGDKVDERIRKESQQLLINIDFAIEHIKTPVDFNPRQMPAEVNALPLQYFPVLTADQQTIFFTGRRGATFYDDEDLYVCQKGEDGRWSLPIPISQNINSQFNEGTCTISADGQILIFTTCEGRKSYGGCDLYITYRLGDEWTPPINLGPAINSRSWESQPSLSADGRKLYFVSDRAGGSGKRDIWVSEKDINGDWLEARNLGPTINTAGDEVSPYIHVNGISLFFASNNLPGFGGYDIYKSEMTSSGWSEPENIGFPINDHNDQVSLFLSVDGTNAYYSFEQKQNGRPNRSLLYTFEYPESQRISRKSNYITGKVFDIQNNQPLQASIELIDLRSDEVVSVFTSNKQSGEYFSILTEGSEYALYVEKEGYLFESRTFKFDNGIEQEPISEDFYLKPIKAGEQTQLNNIYFDTDSYLLREESSTEIKKISSFLADNPNVRIEISGHTDDVGSDAYNMELSEKRAKAVYVALVDNGIDKDRLIYRGYGKTRPLVKNQNEASRQRNRRIEFSIIN